MRSARHSGSVVRWLCCAFFTLSFASAARAESRVFALVVSSNDGDALGQSALSYADDDGARYYQLFHAAAKAPEDVLLLTRFDDNSARLYPVLASVARRPTKAELVAAIGEVGARVAAAHANGDESAFYFVFAGHGEVRNGKGFLGLEGAAIDGSFLEHELIERIPADVKHVVLDSCNSFFVMSPRKPGGRRWATPEDMNLGFAARHPEVGVFLSTNAEDEVFEWSRLESGVFSHEVRSGLRGGADLDGDGGISYLELAAFITRANEGIPRESLRPQLYYRGPEGNRDALLFRASGLRGRRLALAGEQLRAWISDADGERIADLHKDAAPLTLVLPDDHGDLTLHVQGKNPKEAPQQHQLVAEGNRLSMRAVHAESQPRGAQIFGQIFSQPFGRDDYETYALLEPIRSERVYGLSDLEVQRARNYLREIASASRMSRMVRAIVAAGAGGLAIGLGVMSFQRHRASSRLWGASSVGVGVLGVGAAAYFRFVPGPGERAYAEDTLMQGTDPLEREQAFLRTGKTLISARRVAMAERYILTGAMVTGFLASEVLLYPWLKAHLQTNDAARYAVVGAMMLNTLAVGLVCGLIPSAEERLIRTYRRDTALNLRPLVEASAHGAQLGVGGRF